MAIPQKIIKFLEKAKVKHELIEHRTVYTAYDKAATLKVNPKVVGKTLVLRTDKKLVLVLIPGNKNLDINKFKKTAKTKRAGFISEREMKDKFKGVKIGAIPPFGSLWKLPTFADKSLLKESKIIISAGDYNWSIKISPSNFKKLIPDLVIGNFSKAK